MKRPPETLDGARVLYFADVTGLEPSGRTEHFVDDVPVERFDGLAIARDEHESGSAVDQNHPRERYYLFYCDKDWVVVSDALFESPWLCVAQAEWEYEQVMFEAVEPLPPDLPAPRAGVRMRYLSMIRSVSLPRNTSN